MRFFGLALLVVVVAVLSVGVTVYAQERATTARTGAIFVDIESETPSGAILGSTGLFIAEINLSNGVTCYALTNQSLPHRIATLAQFEGLSCVK